MAGPPIIVHACHYTRCQTLTGSALALNAMIESDRVTLLHGTPVEHEIDGGHIWIRCPSCHVGGWSHHPQLGRPITLIAAGTLDDPAAMPPDVHCFTATAHPWVQIPSDLPSSRATTTPMEVRLRSLSPRPRAGVITDDARTYEVLDTTTQTEQLTTLHTAP